MADQPDIHLSSAGGIVMVLRAQHIWVLVGRRTTAVEPKWRPLLCQLPKGSIERGETPEQAALREVREETGYTAHILKGAGTASWSFSRGATAYRETVTFFLMTPEDTPPGSADGEFDSVVWLPLDVAAAALSYPEEQHLLRSLPLDSAVKSRILAIADMSNTDALEHRILASKADTLSALSGRVSHSVIDPFTVFSVGDWQADPESIVERISRFRPNRARLVRSSAKEEDGQRTSLAGHFLTVELPRRARADLVQAALSKVIASYKKDGRSLNKDDQVLVQTKVEHLRFSGVLLTADPRNASPYYVVNYAQDDTRRDGVTSGRVARTVRLPSWIPLAKAGSWRRLLTAIQEIQRITSDHPLDVEFGISRHGQVHIFQVRRLNLQISSLSLPACSLYTTLEAVRRQYRMLSHRVPRPTIYADMADWNPAEILGDRATRLATSLYGVLITDRVWSLGRESLGYQGAGSARLVRAIGNKPYVDCSASFATLLPASLPHGLARRLVSHFLGRLRRDHTLQDKVEFELVLNCLDLQATDHLLALTAAGFSARDVGIYRNALTHLTNSLLSNWRSLIEADLSRIGSLETFRRAHLARSWQQDTTDALLHTVADSLSQVASLGTFSFVRLARLAFVGLSLLRSLPGKTVLGAHFPSTFLSSLSTVASVSADALRSPEPHSGRPRAAVPYAHLRPGTYDIRSPRLGAVGIDEGPSPRKTLSFADLVLPKGSLLSAKQTADVARRLRAIGLETSPQEVLTFAAAAIQARELSKFEFTRALSDTLELIAFVGHRIGIDRTALAHLDVDEIVGPRLRLLPACASRLASLATRRRERHECLSRIAMPAVLTRESDMLAVRAGLFRPTFITAQRVCAPTVVLQPDRIPAAAEIKDRVVLIESADPGYDWLFSCRPSGLITKYGGVASHMAIRCYELSLPAAIGCGSPLFERVASAREVTLDCARETIHTTD